MYESLVSSSGRNTWKLASSCALWLPEKTEFARIAQLTTWDDLLRPIGSRSFNFKASSFHTTRMLDLPDRKANRVAIWVHGKATTRDLDLSCVSNDSQNRWEILREADWERERELRRDKQTNKLAHFRPYEFSSISVGLISSKVQDKWKLSYSSLKQKLSALRLARVTDFSVVCNWIWYNRIGSDRIGWRNLMFWAKSSLRKAKSSQVIQNVCYDPIRSVNNLSNLSVCISPLNFYISWSYSVS